ncbi:MAG: glutathione S-transferase N-terminal domain-containing protein [Tabrizicola sp.]|nr:glutathione S-transferase N-terminal domain-containing protein [Tabrizicola sp.]
MLTLIHAPQSRSTTLLALIDELGIADKITIQQVSITRMDGSGQPDPANPHPEAKVPALVHDGHIITERGAIIAHLTTLFPEAGLAPPVGSPEWGSYLTWLAWYQGVLEPVLILGAAGVEHPFIPRTFRTAKEVASRLRAALEKGPWLLGERFSAADLLVHSPFAWLKDATPDDPLIRDWLARCMARPSITRVKAADQAALAA